MSVTTYDASQVTIVLSGLPLTGFGPDTFVNVEQDEDSFGLQIGADGEGSRSKSNNRSATITVTLLQGSQANDLLSALHNLDINSPAGDSIGPFLLKDNSGRTIINAAKAWIQKPPPVEHGREAGTREWIFRTERIEWTLIGGNPVA
jgi:hypothetical protein